MSWPQGCPFSLSCLSHACQTYLGLAIPITVAVTLLVTFQTHVVIGDMPSLADAGTVRLLEDPVQTSTGTGRSTWGQRSLLNSQTLRWGMTTPLLWEYRTQL